VAGARPGCPVRPGAPGRGLAELRDTPPGSRRPDRLPDPERTGRHHYPRAAGADTEPVRAGEASPRTVPALPGWDITGRPRLLGPDGPSRHRHAAGAAPLDHRPGGGSDRAVGGRRGRGRVLRGRPPGRTDRCRRARPLHGRRLDAAVLDRDVASSAVLGIPPGPAGLRRAARNGSGHRTRASGRAPPAHPPPRCQDPRR